jgi:hypothetical protein
VGICEGCEQRRQALLDAGVPAPIADRAPVVAIAAGALLTFALFHRRKT